MKKAAIITGGSRGIGRALAIRLAEDGYIPIINYLESRAEAEDLAKLTGGEAICADVSDLTSVKEMTDQVYNKFGGIDVLVNNAGISVTGLFTDITPKQEQKLIDINIKGVFNASRCVLPYMIRAKSGKIVNISSMWGQSGASCEVHYSATHAAVIGFTKALAKEVGPSGINVNCIAPGVIDTDMNAHYDSEDISVLKENTPLQRIGAAEDIAQTAAFLVSDAASFITGQIIGVNGGFII